jgi:uncharacterized RDD family membrane protein YckC
MNYGGFFTRFFALLIDEIAMGILAFIVGIILSGFLGLTIGWGGGFMSFLTGTAALLTFFVLFFFQFFYFGYFWSNSGQSVGMKLLDIKVIRRDQSEGLGFWRSALRGTVGYYISGLVFSLGFIWAAFDGDKETWHDKMFDTWVVKSSEPVISQVEPAEAEPAEVEPTSEQSA